MTFKKCNFFIHTTILCMVILFTKNTFCFGTNQKYSDPIIQFSENAEEVKLNNYLLLYKDKKKKLSIKEIINRDFVPNNHSNINLGYNNDADWIKFTIQNSSTSVQSCVLSIDKLLIDSISLYYFNSQSQQWDSIVGGASIPKHVKPLNGLSTYFPIQLSASKTSTFYLRCTSFYGKSFSVTLINDKKLHQNDLMASLNIGIFIGCLLAITLYNLFIGFSVKDKLYLHYALANVFTLLGGLANLGFFIHFLPENLTKYIPYITSTSIALFVVFASNFNIRILELKKYSSFSYYLILGLAYLELIYVIILNIMHAIGKPHHYALIAINALLFSIAALISGIIAQRKGSRYARFYIIAWSLSLIGIMMLTLTLMGYIPKNMVTGNFYEIGSLLEVLLLSFALADRYNVIQKEKNKLELELQYKTNDLSKVVTDNRVRHSFKVNLLDELKSIYQNKGETVTQQLGSFITDLNIQLDAEEKRNQLQENIDIINTEFERKLKERFPKLTKSEIETCGYLKLGLTYKEIANLKRLSETTIKVTRHRINKKMQEAGTTIEEIL